MITAVSQCLWRVVFTRSPISVCGRVYPTTVNVLNCRGVPPWAPHSDRRNVGRWGAHGGTPLQFRPYRQQLTPERRGAHREEFLEEKLQRHLNLTLEVQLIETDAPIAIAGTVNARWRSIGHTTSTSNALRRAWSSQTCSRLIFRQTRSSKPHQL